MKNPGILLLFIAAFTFKTFGQNTDTKKLYDPKADAKSDIKAAVKKADKEGKHVLLQIGGNWCSWCILFDKKVNETEELKKLMSDNYVVYHLNHSPENKNSDILKELEFPQRFGFPVFVILDSKGKRLHTQNSAYLEEGKGHSAEKVKEFLENWSANALNPANYKDK